MQRLSRYLASWLVYVILTLVMIGFIISSILLINYLRKQEISRVKLFAEAQTLLNKESFSEPDVQLLLLDILNDNKSIPVIIVDKHHHPMFMKNIPPNVEKDSTKLKSLLATMERSYAPIEVQLPQHNNQYIYFTNSRLMNNLRYFPAVLALIIAAYIAFSFWFLNTAKKSSEGFLWAGLAKETAHQIGTPLSSMIGWIEILKMENNNAVGVKEIEQDVQRLKVISQRFSKLGSVPELNDLNLKETVKMNFEYLKPRVSSKVEFMLRVPESDVLIPHNRILMNWALENLIKNAVDAMKGQGKLFIHLFEKTDQCVIDIMDTGSGMTKAQARRIFKPGFSTKKRGWGLGLSLAKRAVEEYHKGEIRVHESEIGKGTTFRIILFKNSKVNA